MVTLATLNMFNSVYKLEPD